MTHNKDAVVRQRANDAELQLDSNRKEMVRSWQDAQFNINDITNRVENLWSSSSHSGMNTLLASFLAWIIAGHIMRRYNEWIRLILPQHIK